jgi:hypothetical protein
MKKFCQSRPSLDIPNSVSEAPEVSSRKELYNRPLNQSENDLFSCSSSTSLPKADHSDSTANERQYPPSIDNNKLGFLRKMGVCFAFYLLNDNVLLY